MNERNFKSIPESALRLGGGVVEFGDNGPDAKSARIRLKARSGQPIEHWFWGRIVHDMAGVRHKARIAVDYAHNDSEILGYVNHFDTAGGDLVLSGALTPWREDDRASEVMFKMREGVPYEASIFFGGDGIKLEDVPAGMVAQVNGYQFEGPGIIVRQWPLRGVAVCPYGADANTESAAMSSGKTYAAEVVAPKQENEMSNKSATVEAEVPEEAQAVESSTVEAEVAAKMDAQTDAQPEPLPVDPVVALTAQRDDLAVKLQSSLAKHDADAAALAKVQAERDELAAKLAESVSALADAKTKLDALTAGASPVSAKPAPAGEQLTPWQKAQRSARRK